MLRTPFCDLVGLEAPIVQAAIVPATTPALVAAVSNAGGLGTLGAAFRPAAALLHEIEQVRALTDRPFAVNHVVPLLDEDSFAATLAAKPAVVSLALGEPAGLVERVHEAGALVMHQVHTVDQARAAVEAGADVLVAQGSEAGGNTGMVAMSVLVPQVVDAVGPVPVIAAGGVADGRGLAAVLVLGAAGANVGTRFLASKEASAEDSWKQAIVGARSEDAVRLDFWPEVFRTPGANAYEVAPRSLHTPFTDRWLGRSDDARKEAGALQAEVMGALREGRVADVAPFTGQTAGLIADVRPAAEIVRTLVAEAEDALRRAAALAQ